MEHHRPAGRGIGGWLRKRSVRFDTVGAILVVAAILLAIGIWADALGQIGRALKSGAQSLFGGGSLVLPPVLAGLGVTLVVRGRSGARAALAALAAVASSAVLAHLLGGHADSGGSLGRGLGGEMVRLVGSIGTVLILVAVCLLSALYGAETSIGPFIRHLRAMSQAMRDARALDERSELSGASYPEPVEEPDRAGDRPVGAGMGADSGVNPGIGAQSGTAAEEMGAGSRRKVTASAPEASAKVPAGSGGSTSARRAGEDEDPPALSAFPIPAGPWQLPPPAVLARGRSQPIDLEQVRLRGQALQEALATHGVETRVVGQTVGPTVTRYELELGVGVKVNRVTSLHKDIAYAMASADVRILAPIPGRSAIGVEVPNVRREIVTLADMLASEEARRAQHPLEVPMGRDIAGRPVFASLAAMPHVLVAGATGSGKSSLINSVLTSILMRSGPEDVRLILVDPKRVELGQYNGLPHLLTQVVINPKKAANALSWAVKEMERRYDLLAAAGVRDVTSYNSMVAALVAEAGDAAESHSNSSDLATGAVARSSGRPALPGRLIEGRNGQPQGRSSGEARGGTLFCDAVYGDRLGAGSPGGEVMGAGSPGGEVMGAGNPGGGVPCGDGPPEDPRDATEAGGDRPARPTRLPFILVVVDELNDLMMVAARDVEESICRLAQMARAVGIHLVIATQRPSVDVITGVIKANVPSRLAFAVSSLADSRVILDHPGAERLIGQGDMLMLGPSSSVPIRLQSPFVTEEEVREVVDHWKAQVRSTREHQVPELELLVEGGPASSGGSSGDDDELLAAARELVVRNQMGSTSMLQRRLKVGFARAGRLMDLLEEQGVVGPAEGSKARVVLMSVEELEAS
jgi:DNA segregation ATPase FtsK/SpoIIIE-like protein